MIYPILVLLIVFLEIFKYQKKDTRLDRIYSNLLWILLVLMAAFRGQSVGTDTPGYTEDYEMMPMLSFYQVSIVKQGYLGYFFPCKFFSLIGAPLWMWFGFVEGLYVYAMYCFVRKYSSDRIYSILIFVTNGLFTFSMAGQKQVMSMALMLLAFIYFTDKKYIKMVLSVLWAATCHSSGLIFLIAFALYPLRHSKLFIFLAVGLPVGIYALSKVFMQQIVALLILSKEGSDHYENYLNLDTTYSPVTLIFYIGAIVLAVLFIKLYWEKYQKEVFFIYFMCFMTCALQSLSAINPTLFRLALPYAPFLMVLLPNTSNSIRSHQRRLFYNYAIWVWHIGYFLITTKQQFEFDF